MLNTEQNKLAKRIRKIISSVNDGGTGFDLKELSDLLKAYNEITPCLPATVSFDTHKNIWVITTVDVN